MMTKEELLTLIQYPHRVSLVQVKLLEQIVKKKPYFQCVYILIAKAFYLAAQTSERKQKIQQAILYAACRDHLKYVLTKAAPLLSYKASLPKEIKKSKQALQTVVLSNQERKNKFFNNYIENINTKEKKHITNPVVLDQARIISNFVRKKVEFKMPSIAEQADSTEKIDLAQKSTSLSNRLFTETLAKIILEQGNKKKAIEIYQKLILQNPERRALFKKQINQIINNK